MQNLRVMQEDRTENRTIPPEPSPVARQFNYWPFLILLAGLPLLVAAALLQLLGPHGPPLASAELARLHAVSSAEPFLPGAIGYASISTIHFFVCVSVIIFALLVLSSEPPSKFLAGVGIAMAVGVALLLLGAARFGDSILAYSLSYSTFADLYRGTGVGGWFLETRLGSMTRLGLAMYLPAVLGIFAVALMAAAATGQVEFAYGSPELDEPERERRLCLAHTRIKRCTYALSLVLVTSTVASALFFQLPSKMILSGNPKLVSLLAASNARIDAYGAEMTMFWGAVYSLTLFAAVGVPLLLVQKRVRDFLEGLNPPERADPVRTRMTQAGVLQGGGEQFKVLIAFAAPLVSAPVTSFLQATVG